MSYSFIQPESSETLNEKTTMLNFLKIDSVYDTNYADVYKLYVETFPVSERRSWASLESVLNNENRFNIFALMHENQFVGFISYWKFERFYYIEHFAILPHFRNHKLGSEAMAELVSQVNMPVVLEVEMPRTVEAARRIHFYERLGFYVLSNYYMQPPYDGVSFLLPMLIMSNDYHFANKHFNLIKNTLYKEVYRYEKEDEE
ncbi:MAG: GNAT family N-acetyltransferase [Bacteroidales bacterium]|nr:GNAT family N-acetyltransferase [Bacteroidales bacterium]